MWKGYLTEDSVTDKKKIGYLSVHTPEELILGMGGLPYRIHGRRKPVKLANAYLPKTFDPYVLDSLEGAMDGEYSFLAGVIIANVSDAHRRLYDAWRLSGNPKEVFFLDVPKGSDALRVKVFSSALSSLIKEMETALGVKISLSDLKKAIELCNETRVLLQRLAGLRRQERPPLSGRDFFEVVCWAQKNDKAHVNQTLRKILQELGVANGNGSAGPRLMLTGSSPVAPELISLIEKLGAQVVCEDLCTGMQYFSSLVETNNYPVSGVPELDARSLLGALSERYLKIPTARMVDTESRWRYLCKMVEYYRVDGIIYFALKFDDICLFEYPFLKNKFQKKNCPVLLIEAENFLTSVGQIETRVQAFTEMLV